jgi:hypothetical protein
MRPGPHHAGGLSTLLLLLAAAALSGGGAGVAAQEGNGGVGDASSAPLAPSSVLLPRAEDLALEVVAGNGQFWYLGRQLRAPMVFRVSGPGVDARSCSFIPVGFSSEDADRVTPLVGDPVWEEGQCRVNAWWSLGMGVGRQHLRGEILGGGGRATAHATARQGARLFFGGAWTPRQDGWAVVEGSGAAARVRPVAATGAFRPVLGVDFPLLPSRDRVRLAAAAASPRLDQFFFFGFSVLQALLVGQAQEGSPVDLHMGFQLSRREVARSGPGCAPEPVCTSSDLRFGGLSLMVTVDGGSAFRGLAGTVLR